MSINNRFKLRNLWQNWSPGMVLTHPWLIENNISYSLTERYIKSGWLENPIRGVFTKQGDKPSWAGVVHAIQSQLQLPIHIGARSAIVLQGHGHYVRFEQQINLVGERNIKPPCWLKKIAIKDSSFTYLSTNLFGKSQLGISEYAIDGYKLSCSSLERAILEMLAFAPQHYGYAEAAHLMEGLKTLRPTLVQQLLEQCNSVKAKRLFLHLANQGIFAWLKYLDLSKIDIGSGIRKIPGGTHFDKQFLIYVPETQLNEGYTTDEV